MLVKHPINEMIPYTNLETSDYEVMSKAAIDIPEDYRAGIEQMVNSETGDLSCFVLKTMMESWDAATADRRPMCVDSGLPRYYVKVGNEARYEGGPIAIEKALREATARATHDIPLRSRRRLDRYHHGA